MANARGFTSLWENENVDQDDFSPWAVVGQDPYVTIYICTDVDATFDIEAGLNFTGIEAGLNAIDSSDPSGGLSWHKYEGATALEVVSGVKACYDLSPFGPQFIRLIRTDSGSTANVRAGVTNYGPN